MTRNPPLWPASPELRDMQTYLGQSGPSSMITRVVGSGIASCIWFTAHRTLTVRVVHVPMFRCTALFYRSVTKSVGGVMNGLLLSVVMFVAVYRFITPDLGGSLIKNCACLW
jgi:hypothetical protein